jgi:hypothetical protein
LIFFSSIVHLCVWFSLTSSGPTKALLAKYGQTPALNSMRTPVSRTPMTQDRVMLEAQNLIALTQSKTVPFFFYLLSSSSLLLFSISFAASVGWL